SEKAESGAVKALIFDSQYDTYKGVVVYVKLFSGTIKKGDSLELIHTGSKMEALEVGCFRPKYDPIGIINEGEIGYVVTGLKTVAEAKVGDTLFKGASDRKIPIDGFKRITPFVFAGVYPVDTDEYPKLKDSLDKLMLNDSSLSTENEVSPALGHGFRCGFLGLLHLDIVKERLWREFDMDVIMTSPQVTYRVVVAGDKVADYPRNRPELLEFENKTATAVYVSNPEDLPKPGNLLHIEEPIAKIEIITPSEYVGGLMQLCQERRGKFTAQNYLDARRVVLSYEIPMAELVGDFYDDLKSISSGYGSLSYEFLRYQMDDLHRLDILVAGEKVDAFSMIVHSGRARTLGGNICRKLKDNIPKAQFAIAIQAALGNTVIAREDLSALRKDVTAKLYGGDISRKRKLLEKQKEGKKKMKQFGRVSIPSETFVNILKK
ncbi:MAG: GTP-binding protein LepA, partial [Patescibacteria group bacterium]|nr:GTP-binding protein LepA [Patescibacteria group bacterium]